MSNSFEWPSKDYEPRFYAPHHESNLAESEEYRAYWAALEGPQRAECELELSEYQERQRERRDEEWRKELKDRATCLKLAGVPGKDIQRFIGRESEDTYALRVAREQLEGPPKGILGLTGPPGVGKTTASGFLVAARVEPGLLLPEEEDRAAFARTEEDPFREMRIRNGLGPARFISVASLARVSKFDDKAMSALETVQTLAIDDLGAEYVDARGNFLSTLDGLINARYANDLETIITTNLTPDAFKARYGQRIADRIRETGRFVAIGGESMRGRR